jgi:hypothetical protein
VVGVSDPVLDYLRQVRLSLRTPDADRILAEAEDHLRDAVSAGLAAGLTEREAAEAAVSSFGSVRAVVRAHTARPRSLVKGRRPAAVIGDVIMSAWKLGGIGLTAIGASGVVVLIMNHVLGRAFVGQAPSSVTFPQFKCAYWLSAWPTAHTCAQAAMLENSSDAVVLRIVGGIAGVALLEGYFLFRYLLRRRGREPEVLLAGYFPALAACVFGAGASGLAFLQLTGLTVREGPGVYLSGVIVAAVMAAWYGHRARPVFRHLVHG